jgi:hypothetical protein
LSVFSKPGKRLLFTKPGGGTKPTRDPIGNDGSAACAGRAPASAGKTARNANNLNVLEIMKLLMGHIDAAE